ncbi:mechanosensitive ion channel family protein [Sphingobacterium corticibacter]|uniref:Mechanosensitive ion channel MscS domain-containing protein n=1 Tax=Sphingobacterium corticibacter TaxID=2171749 RepID=A0A2T8HI93_9SPHI|nr:mechanosensitive ion channel domain-containing protein [Sphingobacterium corticibacter]PVH25113.1 hypothetical protein DC487_09280 [Sphingobacterium corticibacter]
MTKKTYHAMHTWFLGILMWSALPLYAQQDSISDDSNSSDTTTIVRNDLIDTTQQASKEQPVVVDLKLNALQGRVVALTQEIDSAKADQDTLRNNVGVLDTVIQPSTVFLNEKVRDITVLKREISRYRQDLQLERQKQSTSANNDSNRVDGVLHELQLGIEDSLMRLDQRLDGLLANVVQIRENLTNPVLTDTLAQDSSYSATMEMPTRRRVMTSIRNNLDSDKPLEQFFDYAAWSSRLLLILLTLGYLYWTFRLGREEESTKQRWRLFKHFPLWIPLVKSLIFFLILLPLTAYVIPIFIIQMSYLIIFMLLYGLHYSQFSTVQRNAVHVVFGVFLLLIVANLIISEALWIRLIAGVLNVFGLIVTWRIGQPTKEGEPANHIRPVAKWAILLGFTVSIISNIFGYVYLARISSIAASVGLIQALALRAFGTMLLKDLDQHYNKVSRENLIRRFDLQRMLNSLNRLISLICLIIVAIVVVNNLNITARTANFLQGVLYKEHALGSITYNYANLLLAILVLWGSNWLQKNLKHLLNDPSSDELQMKRMTLFPLFRLILVVVSFFFAISILGLGLDKLTVIVGALTVGIGFGLQNIINNLVSGVILVFEKPFKIGDYIELADKKGQVLEIGIRSSVLLTDQGAKVIIPNADLFSGRLVNWTFSSTDIRVNLDLSITGSNNIEDVKERLRNRLKNDRFVDKSIPIKVYTKDIQPDTYKISIQVGVKNVRQIERFRSQFLEGIKEELHTLQVNIASV